MAIFSDFTQGSFNPTDSDSTIADSNQVVGFNSPGAAAGTERRFSIGDLRKHITKDQVVRGAGDSTTSNEGGQISFCGSPNGSGNETIAWNLDVHHADSSGLDESVRLFAAGGNRGNGMFEFQKNGKLRMGHRTGMDGMTIDTNSQLRIDVHGTRATTATGTSAWVYRGENAGNNSEFQWGGAAADFPSISIGDVVCVGEQQFGETRGRLGWRVVNGVDAADRRITMSTISGLTTDNQYRLFQEDIGFLVVGKGRDGTDHSKFVVNNDRVNVPAGRLDVTCENNLDTAVLNVYGSGQSDALVYVGQHMTHGFGLLYNGDDSPNAIGTEDDCILFNRTVNGSEIVLKWHTWDTNVRFRSSVKINDSTFTQPAFALDVEGDVRASGNIIAQSDGRYKSDTCTIDNSLEKVKRLRGVSYVKTDSERADMGLVAQELEQVLPELVTTHKGADYDDEKSVNYNGVIPVLIEAIKEQQQQIEQLQQRVS